MNAFCGLRSFYLNFLILPVETMQYEFGAEKECARFLISKHIPYVKR